MRRHAYMARGAPLMFLPLLLLAVAGHAETYQEPEAFVAESFGGTAPEAKILYLNGATAEGYRSIMGEPPRRLRQRLSWLPPDQPWHPQSANGHRFRLVAPHPWDFVPAV